MKKEMINPLFAKAPSTRPRCKSLSLEEEDALCAASGVLDDIDFGGDLDDPTSSEKLSAKEEALW